MSIEILAGRYTISNIHHCFLSSQVSMVSITQTVWSLVFITALMGRPGSWLMPTFPRLGRSILMTVNTGFWETPDSAGKKVQVMLLGVEMSRI